MLGVRLLVAGLFCAAFWACMGRKQNEPKYDMMQNISAKYNIVFHGRKIIDDVERENFAAHRDNYQQLLPVFVEPAEAAASSYQPLMDSVIGKALTIINKKTKSKYVNEAYFLTGRANYLKGSYFNAVEFFTYTANTFADEPEYRQAALVWKARSLMMLGNYSAAGLVLDTVFMGLETEKKSVGLAFATQANHYLLTGNEEPAIDMLLQALEHTRHKPTRLRWHFLVAQLLAKQGRKEEAYTHYNRVVRSNASYEMAFHAGLQNVFLVTGEDASHDHRIRLLRRMLRDDKNKAFRDQIYHQIAEVYNADGRSAEALANYNLALRQESTNRYQTALTYLRVADYYFANVQYDEAKHYYDSTGMFLQADFPEVGAIQRKIANLDDLIAQLQVVAFQDSLQYFAGLPEARRVAEIDSLITHRYASMEEAKKETGSRKMTQQTVRRTPFDDELFSSFVTYTDNRFYFNNQDAMGMGFVEFRRRWGNRQLKDNWKFSDMLGGESAMGNVADVNLQSGDMPEEPAAFDSIAWAENIRRYYLGQLPDTDEKMRLSNDLVHGSLVNVGDLYRDGLRDFAEAAKTYESVILRYPDSRDAALIYYNLYRLYTDLDVQRAAYYREKLLKEFPESVFSQIILDPMYLAKVQQQKQVLDEAYEKVYLMYTEEAYEAVIAEVDEVLGQGHTQRERLSQLSYLRSLAVGRTSGIDGFEQSLQSLVNGFPEDSLITPLAKQHLQYIEENRDMLAARQYAILGVEEGRERFVDEPVITLWPQLVINRGPERERPRRQISVSGQAAQTRVMRGGAPGVNQQITPQQVARGISPVEAGENYYRDMELLPDSATYFFVVNVMNAKVNLAPSRFGIGQFNRARYPGNSVVHQLKAVNGENQLVYIGPFSSYNDAKYYETRILPLLPDIMKIPADLYNTFLITEENFGTLSDFEKIDDYQVMYQEQQ